MLAITARGVTRALVLVTCALALAALVAGVLRFRFGIEHGPLNVIPLFDLDEERSIPTYFSAVLLALAAALLAVIGRLARARRERYAWHWLGLAAIFVLLSIDESISLHERVMWTMQRLFQPTGFLYFGWVVPVGIAAAIVGIAYLRFLVRLPRRTRWLVMSSACVYLAGVLGVEMLGASYAWHHGVGMGKTNVSYTIITGVEEMLEMSGAILFVYALLDHLCAGTSGRLMIRLSAPDQPSSPQPNPAAPPAAGSQGRAVA